MNAAVRSLALAIVALFLEASHRDDERTVLLPVLEEEPVVQNLTARTPRVPATSSSDSISSDNCGHCLGQGGGSDAHHSLSLFLTSTCTVTYMSASFGTTNTARAGNVALTTGHGPRAALPMLTSATAPTRPKWRRRPYTTYDSLFSSGGMHSTVNDYGMSAAISQNGGTTTSISYKYKGWHRPLT